MKKHGNLISAVLFSVLFASCNFVGKDTSIVKLFPVTIGNNYEYIDKDGKIIINPQFGEATVFREGVALVETSGANPMWGFIGEDGKFKIMATYKAATVFSEGLAWVVTENAAPKAINEKGATIITMQDAQTVRIFKEGLAAYSVNDSTGQLWGFVDKNGKTKINPQFSNVGNFNEDKCAVSNKDGKWGYINKEGTLVINYQFDSASKFEHGNAIVASDNKFGVIDANGKFVINPQFSSMAFDKDIYLIQQDGKFGWCDQQGKILINPQFQDAMLFLGHDLAPVKVGDSWGYINKKGIIVINPQFDYAISFNGNLAIVLSNKKIGFIDQGGKYVINPQFETVSRDLIFYTLLGSSVYENVETDYCNIDAIVNRLKKDITDNSVAGMNKTTPISTILAKYKISAVNFNGTLINNERISQDASLNFGIGVVGKSTLPIYFVYTIFLNGKCSQKIDKITKSIQNAFGGYEKDSIQSRGNVIVLRNKSQVISLSNNNNIINVVIESILANYVRFRENGPYGNNNIAAPSPYNGNTTVPEAAPAPAQQPTSY